MRKETMSNGLHWGIFIILALLVSGCTSSVFNTTGIATPILPTAKEITENYNPNYAIALEKVFLGVIEPEGVVHPNFTTISTDGYKVAYAASTNKTKWYMIIQDLKSHELVKGPEFESVATPTFSPDGKHLAYAAMQNGKWFIIKDDKKGPKFDNVNIPTFSPDGGKIAYVAMQNGKQFIMVNEEKGPEYDFVYSILAFSSDGTKMAYGVKQGAKSFIIVDGQKGPAFDVVASPVFNPVRDQVAYIAGQAGKVFVMVGSNRGPEFDGAMRPPVFSPDGKLLAYVAERTGEGKAPERLIVVLESQDNGDLTIHKTFGPLNVSVARLQPFTMGNISGVGWSPTINVDDSKIAYGVNGGPSAAINEPIRTTSPGMHYYIENIIGNSTIEVNGNVVANVNNTGLVTPLSFSPDSNELSWIVLTKERKLYLKRLKLK